MKKQNFTGTHYDAGYALGTQLLQEHTHLLENVPFEITKAHIAFMEACMPYYERYVPKLLEELQGLSDAQEISFSEVAAALFSMYCLIPQAHCSCFAYTNKDTVLLGRNSDFLTALQEQYMHIEYQLYDAYAFVANTTAFIEMEDGMNAYGFSIGLTSVNPKVVKPGLQAGILLRYGLENCKTCEEFIQALHHLPIASSSTFIAADALGYICLIECNCEKVCVYPLQQSYVYAVNRFYLQEMQPYVKDGIDDWMAEQRHHTLKTALHAQASIDADFAKALLAGKYGFLCQYDRKEGRDTVWSVLYEPSSCTYQLCEGNPSEKAFRQETFPFSILPI